MSWANAANNPYSNKGFFEVCENDEVPHDPMKCRDKKFYWTYQKGVKWPDYYIGPDPMTCWIIEKSQGFTDTELLRISESVRLYVYLILSSQASARSRIIGNMTSALTAQKAFLNNFENAVDPRVDVQEDIKQYQETLSYALSKADDSMGESMYMLPSEMNLNIKLETVGYNNKILLSDGTLSLGKNHKVNTLQLAKEGPKISHKVVVQPTIITHNNLAQKQTITHEEEKVALVLSLAGGFAIRYAFL